MIEKTLRSNVYYIDTFAQQSTHEMFNSSLILMSSMVFNSIKCNVSKSSFLAFKNIINTEIPSNLSFNYLSVVGGESKFSLILRYLFGSVQNIRYLIVSPKNAIIIFPFNNLFSLRILNSINKILKRKIIIFCHSEMEGIVGDLKGIGFLHATLARLSRKFFLNPNVKISDGIYFSVMGDVLKKNLSEIIPSDKIAKFISVDHPYIFKKNEFKEKPKNELFHIGTVGTFNKLKGLDKFITFVTKINSSIRTRIKISVIGRVSSDRSLLEELNVDTLPNNSSLSRKDFNSRIQNLDLILFFYPIESYRITASGAIVDAVLNEKPILALKNDYFVYLFDKFGEFGYLKDNTEEMIDKLYEVMTAKKAIDIDFMALKDKFSPAKISQQLIAELNQIGYLTL